MQVEGQVSGTITMAGIGNLCLPAAVVNICEQVTDFQVRAFSQFFGNPVCVASYPAPVSDSVYTVDVEFELLDEIITQFLANDAALRVPSFTFCISV